MSILSAVILGVIQGVAEFLPISSSGHLAIAQNLLGLKIEGSTDGTFDVLLHLGTLIAVFVAYWPDIVDMIREFFLGVKDIARGTTPTPVPPNRRMILLLIIGTLPLFVIVPIKDYIERLSANTIVVGCALLITGVLLFFSDRYNRGKKNAGSVPLRDVLVIGVAQAFATIPGLSRSGTTVSVGCFLGLDRALCPALFFFDVYSRSAWRQYPEFEGYCGYRCGYDVAAGVYFRCGNGGGAGISLHPAVEICDRERKIRRVLLLLLGSRRADDHCIHPFVMTKGFSSSVCSMHAGEG